MQPRGIVPQAETPDNGFAAEPTQLWLPPGVHQGGNGQPLGHDGATEPARSAKALPDAGLDPFNAESLRLSQDLNAAFNVHQVLLSVPVRKPDKSWFVRTHPDPAYQLQTAVLEVKGDRGKDLFLVSSSLWSHLTGEPIFRPKLLVTAMNRQGTLFLWDSNLPGPDGRINDWTRSCLDAINRAQSKWVRAVANMSVGAYDLFVATGTLGEPEWPATTFKEILKVAFKDRRIDDLDHPVLRRLRGEI